MTPNGSIIDRLTVNASDNDQLGPDVAFGGSQYLVCWWDRRNVVEQVYCARVTGTGQVLDPEGKRLDCQDSTRLQSNPAVASNGSGFLVVWNSTRYGGTMVQCARVGPDGRVLDSLPIDLTCDSLFQEWLAVESNGTDYLVVWSGEEPNGVGQDLYCIRVSSQGTVLDSAPRLVCRTHEGLYDPAVAFLGDRYLVVWTDVRAGFDIYGSMVLEDGTVRDPGGFPICDREEQQREPDVATDGERFLVVWSDWRGEEFDIYGAFVDTSGAVGLNSAPDRGAAQVPLLRAMPNPASQLVHFEFHRQGPAAGVDVLDARGRLVCRLPEGTLDWDRRDRQGRCLPAGVYFARVPGEFAPGCRLVLTE